MGSRRIVLIIRPGKSLDIKMPKNPVQATAL